MSHHPILHKICRVSRGVAFYLALAMAVVLWQLDRGLPGPVCRWLERELSKGVVATRFDEASFSLFDGVRIKNAEMFLKHRLGPPLLKAGSLRLRGKIFFDRPVSTWIREVEAEKLVCQPEMDFPPVDSRRPVDFAAYLRHLSVENDWASEPVHFVLRDSIIYTVSFSELEFDAKIDGTEIAADSIRLTLESLGFEEELKGRMTFQAADTTIAGRLSGTLTPEVVRDLTILLDGEDVVEYYDALGDFSSPFRVDATLRWMLEKKGRPVSTQEIGMTIRGDGFTYNGLPVKQADFALKWDKHPQEDCEGGVFKKISIVPLHCLMKEGEADLRAEFFPRRHKMDFVASANLHPSSLVALLGAKSPSFLTNVSFSVPPAVKAMGTVGTGPAREKLRVAVSVDDADGTLYRTPFQSLRTSCLVEGRDDMRVSVPDFHASCYDGIVKGSGTVFFPPGNDAPAFTVSVRIEDVNCGKARLRAGINDAGDLEGKISGKFDFSGTADDRIPSTIAGSAEFKIRGGSLLRFPLFAGLTDFLGRNIPGVDFLLMQSDADIAVEAANGLAKIRRLSLEGNVFSLVAEGRCRLNKPGTPVEMVAQLRFFKQRTLMGRLARLIMLPASKFMEFRVTGPIEKASWNYIGIVDRLLDWTFWPEKDATDMPGPESGDDAPAGKDK